MRVLNNFDHVDTWKPILNSFFDREKNARDDELSQNVKVLDRPAFPAHFNIIFTSRNDHDTSYAVTKLMSQKRSAILRTSKTGRNVGFKDILTSENPENNS